MTNSTRTVRTEGKIAPQSVDLEELVCAVCLTTTNARDMVEFLKPEHFYDQNLGKIFNAIKKVGTVDIISVKNYLSKTEDLELIGGSYKLVQLANKASGVYSIEENARIIQEHFIRREVIRIAAQKVAEAYDTSSDSIKVFDSFYDEIQGVENIFSPTITHHNIISDAENEAEYLDKVRNGTMEMGKTTGFQVFDQYFRFKPASFVIVNGHDNVGKTDFLLFMAVCSNVLHGWKWILACLENNESIVRQKLIQFKAGKNIKFILQADYEKLYKWATENFTILRVTDLLDANHLLRIARKINDKKPHQAFLIDPYNALNLDIENTKMSSHEYHYMVTSNMRNWIKQTGCCIYLNTHAVTEALRKIHKDGDYVGFPMPPNKADVEGGGKFANRADDFLTIHRYIQHPTKFPVTMVHVRKIKDTETGGRPTMQDEPVCLTTIKGFYGFFDTNGQSPLLNIGLSQTDQEKVVQRTQNIQDDPPF